MEELIPFTPDKYENDMTPTPSPRKARSQPRPKGTGYFSPSTLSFQPQDSDDDNEAGEVFSTPPSRRKPRNINGDSGLAENEKGTHENEFHHNHQGHRDGQEVEEVDLEEFDLGGLSQEEVWEINRLAPAGQRLQDVVTPRRIGGRQGIMGQHSNDESVKDDWKLEDSLGQ